MVAFITLYLSRKYIFKQKEQREINANPKLRALYEKDKHSKQIAYGPHLFFRTVKLVITRHENQDP